MKKILRILGIIVLTFIVLAVILAIIQEKVDGPTQTFAFYNTSNMLKDVTFQLYWDDGTIEDSYTNLIAIEPGDTVFKQVPPGTYKIVVWDENNKFYNKVQKFSFELPEGKSDYHAYYFDLSMDKNFGIASLNHLFAGGDFAESMANAVGTNKNLTIEIIYPGTEPFQVNTRYSNRTFLDLYDALPKEIKYGELLYGMFAVPDNITTKSEFFYAVEDLIKKRI